MILIILFPIVKTTSKKSVVDKIEERSDTYSILKSIFRVFLIIFLLLIFSPQPAYATNLAEQTGGWNNQLNVWQAMQELGSNLSGNFNSFTFRVSTSVSNSHQFDYTALNTRLYDYDIVPGGRVVASGCFLNYTGSYLHGLTFHTENVPAGYEDVTIDFSCNNFTFITGHRYLIRISNANLGGGILFAAAAYGPGGSYTTDFFASGGLRYGNGNRWDWYYGSGSCWIDQYIWGDNTQHPRSGCNVWTSIQDDLYFIISDTPYQPPIIPTPPTSTKTPIIIVPGIVASSNWKMLMDRGDSGWDWMVTAESNWRQFIDSLEKAGYQKDKDYFIAFYDWRKTNDWTNPDPGAALPAKKYLAETIDKAKAANPGISKVNVVAHSMGGLVVRSYVESPNYRGDIDKAFLIGSPNNGSSFAYYTWEGGEVSPNWDPVQKAGLSVIIKMLSINFLQEPYQMIHDHIKSIKDLLPVGYDYIFKNANLLDWTNMQEINNFLKNTSNSQNTYSIFTNKGVRLTNITGTGQVTWEKLLVQDYSHPYFWKDGKPIGNSITADGDNTVLTSSSNLPGAEQSTIISSHANLPNTASSLIFDKLGINYTPSTLAGAPNEVMVAWVASPVTLEVKDNQGNSVGESLVDPTGEMKWVFVENPASDYKINLVGTGNGEYHVGVDYYTDTKTESSQTQGTAVTGAQLNYNLHLDSQNTQPVNLQPEDKVPPTTISQIQGTLGNNNWYTSDVNVSLSATDNVGGSRIDKTEYSFDNTNWQKYTTPVTINKEGITPVYYRSFDLVGNQEQVQQINIKVDKTAPEARIFVDANLNDLVITGIDQSPTTVQRLDNTETKKKDDAIYIITDEAGNTLKIDVRERDKDKQDRFRVYSLQYNNNPQQILENNHFNVSYQDKKDKLNIKEQNFEQKGEIKIRIQYDLKKDKSTIIVKEPKEEKIKEIKNGLVILQLTTNNGVLETIY